MAKDLLIPNADITGQHYVPTQLKIYEKKIENEYRNLMDELPYFNWKLTCRKLSNLWSDFCRLRRVSKAKFWLQQNLPIARAKSLPASPSN